MAYYDVNAASDKPNYLNSFRQGQQYGVQLRQQQQAQQDQNALRELAPQIVAGDPAAFQQAAAIDPQAATSYQGAGASQFAKLGNMVDYIDQAKKSGNQAALTAALGQAWPYIRQVAPGAPEAPPTAFTPEMEQGWEALKAKVAMAKGATQGNVQSTYVDGDGNRVAIMRDGTQQVLGPNDAGMASQTITVTGADGRQRQMTFNKRTGSYEEAQFGQTAPQAPSQPAAMQQVQYATSDGQPIPQEDYAAVQAAMQATARGEDVNIPASGPAPAQPPQGGALPPRLDYQNGGSVNPFVGRSPEEQAAATTAAQEAAKLQYLPQELGMRTQADLDKAAGTGAITRQNEVAALDTTRARDANKTLGLLAEAEQLLPGATGSRAGSIADQGAAFFGTSTPGAKKTAALKTIAGQLTSSMPRMQGPQSDKDVQLYKEMAGDLANDALPVDTRMAALEQIRRLNEKYAGQQTAAPAGSAIRINNAADYDAVPSGATYIAPDGTQRRKR